MTVSLQLYDLLQQQSNFSRMVSASQRNDTWYNSINSYAMIHVVYRFNLFGGKSARQGQGMFPGGGFGPDGGGMPRGGFNPGGGGGMPRGGGFGGGRPMGGMM